MYSKFPCFFLNQVFGALGPLWPWVASGCPFANFGVPWEATKSAVNQGCQTPLPEGSPGPPFEAVLGAPWGFPWGPFDGFLGTLGAAWEPLGEGG